MIDFKEVYWSVLKTEEDKEELRLLAELNTIQDLADMFNVSYGKVATVCRFFGIKCKIKEVDRTKILHKQCKKIDEIDASFVKEHTIKECCEEYKTTEHYIKLFCKVNNVECKKKDHTIAMWASTYNNGRIRYVYYDMLKRCYKESDYGYAYYGKIGIKVCDEWKNDCCEFYKWAKESGYEKGMTLDRIDVYGNYCPENCRWVTIKEQANNKRNNRYITFNGETLTISQWEDKLGFKRGTIRDRIERYGWSIEKALTESVASRHTSLK